MLTSVAYVRAGNHIVLFSAYTQLPSVQKKKKKNPFKLLGSQGWMFFEAYNMSVPTNSTFRVWQTCWATMDSIFSFEGFYRAFDSPREPNVVHRWAAPGPEYTVAPPVSPSEGNTGPLWRDVDPSLLHLLPLMDSMSPLQVCISLIKRCLCASCLPSARFIIKVSEWEKKKKKKALWGEKTAALLGLQIYEAAFMGEGWGCPRCSSCWTHSCLFAKGALAVYPRWLVAPCPCPPSPYTYH